MGMFDSIWVDCPSCGAKEFDALEFQSKAGECILANYTLDTVPVEVLLGAHPFPETCRTCNKQYYLEVKLNGRLVQKVVDGLTTVLNMNCQYTVTLSPAQ